MKRNTAIAVALFLAGITIATLYAGPAWYPIGLDGHTVNSIVVNSSGGIIAGTDKGLYIQYQSRDWLTIPVTQEGESLPVQDIIVLDSFTIVAAAASGSQSDGVYAYSAIWGPPYYAFIRYIDTLAFPQALAKTGQRGDTVYVGNGNSVSYTVRDSSIYLFTPLTPLKIPPYSFGVETPVCAALHVFSDVRILFAGGYDRSPLQAQGHLLWLQKDSMTVCANLNVSALVEGCTNIGGPYMQTLYIGTTDDGIYSHSIISSSLPQKYSGSPNNEMIYAMMMLPGLLWNDVLCVAVGSGVYMQSGAAWIKLDTLPAYPLCLAKKQSTTGPNGFAIYAGTSNGVYVFDSLAVGIREPASSVSEVHPLSIMKRNSGTVALSFSLTTPGPVSVDILDCFGKLHETLCRRPFSAGDHSVTWHTAEIRCGMYIIRFAHEGATMHKRFVVVH